MRRSSVYPDFNKFRVCEYDFIEDNYLLTDLRININVWASCDDKLEVNEIYSGGFSFDPRESLKREKLPKFILKPKDE